MKIFFIVFLILALMSLGLWLLVPNYFLWTSNEGPGTQPVACTLDAKLCPDGSYVGRVPPDCQFAACPGN